MKLFFFGQKPSETAEKTAVWDREEHLFEGVTYRCRECGGRFNRPSEYCPGCRAKVVRIEYDPEWVDEIEFLEL